MRPLPPAFWIGVANGFIPCLGLWLLIIELVRWLI